MKKTILFIGLLIFCFCLPGNLYAGSDSTSFTAVGAARNNDLNMYGKNIINVGQFTSEVMIASQLIDKDNPNFKIDPSGTSILNRLRTPFAPVEWDDVVTKKWVDDVAALGDLNITIPPPPPPTPANVAVDPPSGDQTQTADAGADCG